MKTTTPLHRTAALFAFALLAIFGTTLKVDAQTLSIGALNTAVTTDFNGWNGTLPTGFAMTGNGATYRGSTAGTTGGVYAVANSGFGWQASSSATSISLTGTFANNTGSAITSLTIDYDAFRIVTRTSRTPGWTVTSSLGDVSALNWTYDNSVTAGSPAQPTLTLSNLNIAVGSTFTFTFASDRGAGSNSSPLIGLNNISLTAAGAAATPGNFWAGAAGGGGSGVWTSTGTNWATGANGAGRGGAQATSGALVFTNAAGTVDVGDPVTVNAGMQFATDGYTVRSNTITLAGANAAANTITTDANVGTTINSVLAGSNGLTKAGSGTLTLGGANTFGGVLTVAEGKLTVSTINNANEAGVLGESGNAVVLGSSGQTGFLHYIGTTNASSTKNFTAADGGTAGIEASNAATSLTLSGVIDGTGNVQKGGAGTIILAGENTFSGALNIHDGTVQVGALSGLGNATSIGIGKSGIENVSTLRYTGNSATISQNIALESSNNVSGVIDVATSGQTLTVSGVISGSSGLTKTGIGRLNLSANSSSYNGPVTVSAGILAINGITGNGAVSVDNGATLEGSGTIGGATTIHSGAIHSPGNSPGLQTFGSGLTYSTGSTFTWELTANTTTGRGTSFDGVDVTGGTLTINSGVTNNLVFNASGSSVSWNDSFWNSNQTWLVFSNANAPSLASESAFQTLTLSADADGLILTAVRQNASFSWRMSGSELYLDYAAVPEPSTYALLGLSALALGAYRWRRRRRAN